MAADGRGGGVRGESLRQYNPLPSGNMDKESREGSGIRPNIFHEGEDLTILQEEEEQI